jgi:hypothetical protein
MEPSNVLPQDDGSASAASKPLTPFARFKNFFAMMGGAIASAFKSAITIFFSKKPAVEVAQQQLIDDSDSIPIPKQSVRKKSRHWAKHLQIAYLQLILIKNVLFLACVFPFFLGKKQKRLS